MQVAIVGDLDRPLSCVSSSTTLEAHQLISGGPEAQAPVIWLPFQKPGDTSDELQAEDVIADLHHRGAAYSASFASRVECSRRWRMLESN